MSTGNWEKLWSGLRSGGGMLTAYSESWAVSQVVSSIKSLVNTDISHRFVITAGSSFIATIWWKLTWNRPFVRFGDIITHFSAFDNQGAWWIAGRSVIFFHLISHRNSSVFICPNKKGRSNIRKYVLQATLTIDLAVVAAGLLTGSVRMPWSQSTNCNREFTSRSWRVPPPKILNRICTHLKIDPQDGKKLGNPRIRGRLTPLIYTYTAVKVNALITR